MTDTKLKVGDSLEFIVAATDPEDMQLEYSVYLLHKSQGGGLEWQEDNVLMFTVDKHDVRRAFQVRVRIKSSREYHASGSYDDEVLFTYEVLPSFPPTV